MWRNKEEGNVKEEVREDTKEEREKGDRRRNGNRK